MKILKYKLERHTKEQVIDVPAGGIILDIQLQYADDIVLWVCANETNPTTARFIRGVEDDGELLLGQLEYIATVQTTIVKNTYHFFERK